MQPSSRGHKSFEHTADLGLLIWGPSFVDLLEETVMGLAQLIAEIDSIEAKESRHFSIKADDREELLVSLANEVLFYVDAEGFLACKIKISFAGKTENGFLTTGEFFGEIYNKDKHVPLTEIKSATYHDLLVEEQNGQWKTRVVFDV